MTPNSDDITRSRFERALQRGGTPGRTSATPPPAWSSRPIGSSPEPEEPPDATWRDEEVQPEPQRIGEIELPQATIPSVVPPEADALHPALYFNRELSWLDFNWRVLYQALDERNPLLERLRFLAITENNLDEFVMKRVGGLKRQREAGVVKLSIDGRTPGEQLDLIRESVRLMRTRLAEAWEDGLRASVADEAGTCVRDFESLSIAERAYVHSHFREKIYPILTPLAVDPGHPFPFLSNLSLSLAVMLGHPDRKTRHFARIKIPTNERWVYLPDDAGAVPVEQVVAGFVDELFRGMRIESTSLFRVTRNADVGRDEEVADDLLKMIGEELRERKFASVVRLEVEPTTPDEVRDLLVRELELDEADVYEVSGLLDMSGFWELADQGPWENKYEPWEPVIPPELVHEGETGDAPDIFAVIRAGDLMVHHPYDSFDATVLRFIEEAAADPAVVAIKQTLYRTSPNSEIIDALVRAAERGKQVAVLVEVTARFDEADNMEWASVLDEAGVHVTYGVVGLKTHTKVALVIREEDDGFRTYCHVGTGNYHSQTAHVYADIGIITARPEVGRDAVNLFHYLTGYAPEQEYEELIVAPRDLRKAVIDRIEREAEHARAGRGGRLAIKMNGLDDHQVMEAMYAASRDGVEIDLIVRGHCALRPGLSGWSDRIRVRSIVGRFLEHDRIYWFENDGEPEVWIGSADCRRRNLDDRVELMLPIRDRRIIKRLRRTLRYALRDTRNAWDLRSDGRYAPAEPEEGGREIDYHRRLMRRVRKTRRKADARWDLNR